MEPSMNVIRIDRCLNSIITKNKNRKNALKCSPFCAFSNSNLTSGLCIVWGKLGVVEKMQNPLAFIRAPQGTLANRFYLLMNLNYKWHNL